MTDEHDYRLPRAVVPRRYELTLAPDLAAATFSGEAAIEVDVAETVEEIVVNAVDLEIDEAWLVDSSGETLSAAVTLDPAQERARLALDGVAQPGPAVLHARFRGVLNDQLRGFYRSTFKDESGADKVIATTQFESTSARRAFPCWDEPDLKAIFSVTLVVADGLAALANSRQISDEPTGDGRRRVRFADTMLLSTYLVAFIVGELEMTEPIDVGGVPLRIVHQPGKAALAGFAEECGAFAVSFFADYFGIPYPTDKLDLVALPDFAAGAMENLGLVTFREALLLVDPTTATQAEGLVIANVVAHEIAHMWFGDLVTMRWWNGLWLKEAFATFMANICVDAMKPDWHVWDTFGLDRTAALETDALESTRAIEYPVHSPHDAEGMYDVLTYEKGAAVLRMLEQYLGAEEFRAGVHAYLSKHAYGNTENTDLWDAIEAVTSEPARRIMDAWIFQGGYPLVRASLAPDGTSVQLTQRRFVYSDVADATLWPVPLHVRQSSGGTATTSRMLLDAEQDDVALAHADAVVLVNAGGHGFLRVRYEAPLLDRLAGPALAELSTIERYNLVDDAWAAVIAGEAQASEYLRLARGFGDESTLPVWQALSAGLGFCDRLLDDGEAREQFRTFVRGLAGPALHRLGWAPRAGEDDLTGELRGLLIRTVAIVGNDRDVQAKARALYRESLDDPGSVAPPVASAALTVFAWTGDDADYEHVLEVFETSTNPQEQLRHLWALADFVSADLMTRTCELTLTDRVRSQNAPFLLARCIRNRDQGEQAWRFVARNWTTLNERFPSTSIIRMVDGVRMLMRPEQASEVRAFFSERGVPQAAKTLEQVLERQQINSTFRSRESEQLAATLR
ncbi:MAG TPA: M1 family metallopeptidase [Acidimicrobiales bacterium]|nr:M1 family metallopeptidase [Acidimicrobiales bacterium]